MKTTHLCLLVMLLALILPASVVAGDSEPPMESANYLITWSTLEEDHGSPAESDNFTMAAAVVGQAVAQETGAGGEYLLCPGFLCLPKAHHQIFLPLILRQ
jgi:hypothetical protein